MLNFFDPMYQETPINDSLFGLCDNEDGNVAFTDTNTMNMVKWIATVENQNKIELTFTAIDNGIIKDSDYPCHGRCDGMLASNEHLYFIELKNLKEDWIQKGILQLESTIKIFDTTHPGKIAITTTGGAVIGIIIGVMFFGVAGAIIGDILGAGAGGAGVAASG